MPDIHIHMYTPCFNYTRYIHRRGAISRSWGGNFRRRGSSKRPVAFPSIYFALSCAPLDYETAEDLISLRRQKRERGEREKERGEKSKRAKAGAGKVEERPRSSKTTGKAELCECNGTQKRAKRAELHLNCRQILIVRHMH